MPDYIVTTSELRAIADTIRSKGKTSSPLSYPLGFVSAISNIKTAPILSEISIVPNEQVQTVYPDSGYDAFSQVFVQAISSNYVGTGIPRRSLADITANAYTVTIPYGYYSQDTEKIVQNGSAFIPAVTINATPTITVNNYGLITATISSISSTVSPIITGGYISNISNQVLYLSGSSTFQMMSQPAITVTPNETVQTVVSSGRYLTGVVTINPIPSTYVGTGIDTLPSTIYTPGVSSQIISAYQYLTGNQTILGDSNLVASNIRINTNVFGITGTYIGYENVTIPADEYFSTFIRTSAFSSSYENSRISYICPYAFASTQLRAISIANCKEIGDYAFASCAYFNSVYAPLCEKIGAYAFYSTRYLLSISFPNCTEIMSHAFHSTQLSLLNLPACISIGAAAFAYIYSSYFSHVYLPVCEYIGDYCFSACSGLQTISLPSCKYIGSSAFVACRSLYSVSIPVCETIKQFAFAGCPSFKYLNAPALTSVCDNFCSSNAYIQSVSCPVCSDIGSSAFQSCTALNNVYFPSCTIIHYAAFRRCYSLPSVEFLNCQTIENEAFASCSALSYVSFPLCTSLSIAAFNYCSSLKEIHFHALTSFPTGIKSTSQIFSNCQLEVIDMPNLISVSNSYVFFIKSNIYSINLQNCQEIGIGAFEGTKITNLNLPSCVDISNWAFRNNSLLTSLSLPNVVEIGPEAFKNCSSLESLYLPLCTRVDMSAFYNCSSLSEVSLPLCSSVNLDAFRSCVNLKKIYIGGSSIGSYAFADCTSLSSIDLPNCRSIWVGAFYGCTSLTNVVLPGCNEIGSDAFYNCYNLSTVELAICWRLFNGAFRSCSALSSLYLLSNNVVVTPGNNCLEGTAIANGSGTVYVPASLVSNYRASAFWYQFNISAI